MIEKDKNCAVSKVRSIALAFIVVQVKWQSLTLSYLKNISHFKETLFGHAKIKMNCCVDQ